MEHFKEEWNDKSPLLYHLAQIAHQVYLIQFMFGGTPKLALEDFLIPFTDEERPREGGVETEEQRRARISATKSMFIGALSIAAKGASGKAVTNRKGKEKGDRLPREKKDNR